MAYVRSACRTELAPLCDLTYWPLVYNGYLSFVRWDMLAQVNPGGARQLYFSFQTARICQDHAQYRVFTIATVLATCILGLAIALLLNMALRGRNLVRSVVFSPVMLSGAAIGIVWTHIDLLCGCSMFFSGHWPFSPNWLLDTNWAMAAVVIVYVFSEECGLCGGHLSGWLAGDSTRALRAKIG